MAKGLIQNIAESLKAFPAKVLLVENNDRFLYRSDVQNVLIALGIEIISGTKIEQRVRFEIREPDCLLVLLSQDNSAYLEDIKNKSFALKFSLSDFLQGYHIPSLVELNLSLLDNLFSNKPLVKLNRSETQKYIKQTKEKSKSVVLDFNLYEFVEELNSLLKDEPINWSVLGRLIARGIRESIGKPHFNELFSHVNKVNAIFQDSIKASYQSTKNSSAIKKPRIVSKILDYLNFNFREKKIALIVVDGLALWQYELIRDHLPGIKNEEVIYSWLPSITQLSRQAIFRGGSPNNEYKQGPVNEEKLWKAYWKNKGVKNFEIIYQHEKIDLENISSVSKLAIVFKDLDEKMHSSTDYVDLITLTKNWIERTKISQIVEDLLLKGFIVFFTSDHGNIQAKGWRGLKGREKLGTNKSGSRSERHIEYPAKWLLEEFMKNNPEMESSVVIEDQTIYFNSELSFSNKDSLVTHGGAHMLEVLIPFIEIKNGQ